MSRFERIAFVASDTRRAQQSRDNLIAKYGSHEVDDADVIVALGGDGFMLQTLHRTLATGIPVYGMKRGTVGFLMNLYAEEDLPERLQKAHSAEIHPLRMLAKTAADNEFSALAINEVSLLRQTKQAAKIRVLVNDEVKLDELICDGIMVATPAGSTAYNLSAHGPIIPLGANIHALTPISPFRPRRWRGALLHHHHRVVFEIREASKRPVSATADAMEVRDVVRVEVEEADQIRMHMLFDPEHNLDERILNEQFAY